MSCACTACATRSSWIRSRGRSRRVRGAAFARGAVDNAACARAQAAEGCPSLLHRPGGGVRAARPVARLPCAECRNGVPRTWRRSSALHRQARGGRAWCSPRPRLRSQFRAIRSPQRNATQPGSARNASAGAQRLWLAARPTLGERRIRSGLALPPGPVRAHCASDLASSTASWRRAGARACGRRARRGNGARTFEQAGAATRPCALRQPRKPP